MTKEQIYKIVATAVTALLTCLAIALGLSSCNVTRVVRAFHGRRAPGPLRRHAGDAQDVGAIPFAWRRGRA